MKKQFILSAILVLLIQFAMAFPPTAALELVTRPTYSVHFEVNGTLYPGPDGTLYLDGLRPGGYDIRVVQTIRSRRGPNRVINRVLYSGRVYLRDGALMSGQLGRYGMEFSEQEFYRPPAPSVYEMCPAAFSGLLSSLRSTSFDRTKLEIAKSALNQNNFTTQQIKQMVRQFSFDRYRLEVARSAYSRCIDPNNYYRLTQVLTFDSNKRALMNSIH